MSVNKFDSALSYIDKDENVNIIRPKTLAKNIYLESSIGSISAGSTLTEVLNILCNSVNHQPYKRIYNGVIPTNTIITPDRHEGHKYYNYIKLCDFSDFDFDYTDYNNYIVVSIDKKLSPSTDFEFQVKSGAVVSGTLNNEIYISTYPSDLTGEQKFVLGTATYDTAWSYTKPDKIYLPLVPRSESLYLVFNANDNNNSIVTFADKDINFYVDVVIFGEMI